MGGVSLFPMKTKEISYWGRGWGGYCRRVGGAYSHEIDTFQVRVKIGTSTSTTSMTNTTTMTSTTTEGRSWFVGTAHSDRCVMTIVLVLIVIVQILVSM